MIRHHREAEIAQASKIAAAKIILSVREAMAIFVSEKKLGTTDEWAKLIDQAAEKIEKEFAALTAASSTSASWVSEEEIARALWESQRARIKNTDGLNAKLKWRDEGAPQKFWEHYTLDGRAVLAFLSSRTATAQVTVPVGWQLVPVEPTQAMVSAGTNAAVDANTILRISDKAYRAMLAAAPLAAALSQAGLVEAQVLLKLIEKRDPSNWVLHEIWRAGESLRAAIGAET